MLIEQVYPHQTLIVSADYARKPPGKGAKVLVSGDPDRPPLEGEVFATLEVPGGGATKVFIDVDEHLEGAAELASWLQDHGDVGIMEIDNTNEEV